MVRINKLTKRQKVIAAICTLGTSASGEAAGARLRHISAQLDSDSTRELRRQYEILFDESIDYATIYWILRPDTDSKSKPKIVKYEDLDIDAIVPTELLTPPNNKEDVDGDPTDVLTHIQSLLPPMNLERQMHIFRNRWVGQQTLEEIGDVYGVSRERIRQLEVALIKRLRDPQNGLESAFISERLHSIESLIFNLVNQLGGAAELDSIEDNLGWPEKSIRTWVVLNNLSSVLNEEQTPTADNGVFGRMVFFQSILATLDISEYADKQNEGYSAFRKRVSEIIGSPGIMLMEDLRQSLLLEEAFHNIDTSDSFNQAILLQNLGVLYLLKPETGELDQSDKGVWVASAFMTKPCREIARAILHRRDTSTENTSTATTAGLRSDLISIWLEENSDHQSNDRAIDSVCQRNVGIFVRTGPTSWGLIGAGAEEYQAASSVRPRDLVVYSVATLEESQQVVRKQDVARFLDGYLSGAWVNQTIDTCLAEGSIGNKSTSSDSRYRYNLGAIVEPKIDRLPPKPPKQPRGLNINLVIEILSEGPLEGLSQNEILRRVRERHPDFPSNSLNVYLRHYSDRIERDPISNKYRLVNKSTDLPTDLSSLSTINVLTNIMASSSSLLTVEEIFVRCKEIKSNIKASAIRGYLSGGYGGRFVRGQDGRYSISKDFEDSNTESNELWCDNCELTGFTKKEGELLWICNTCGTPFNPVNIFKNTAGL